MILVINMLFACGWFASETIERIEVFGPEEPVFLDQFDLSDYHLVIHKSSGITEEVELTEALILDADRDKLSQVGQHRITVVYQAVESEFSVNLLNRLFIEKIRLIYDLEDQSIDFETWLKRLEEHHSTIDFNKASLAIDVYGEVFIETDQRVSLGHLFQVNAAQFEQVVEDYRFDENHHLILKSHRGFSLNFGPIINYWEDALDHPYDEYRLRFSNYDRSEEQFIVDLLMGQLNEDNRYQLHLSSEVILDFTALYDLESHAEVQVIGVVSDVLTNGFIISDGQRSVLIYTFGQTAYRNIEEGMLIEITGHYLRRNQAYYIRPTDSHIFRENEPVYLPVHEVSIPKLYEDYLVNDRAFNQRYRLQGGLFFEDGHYYLRDSRRDFTNDLLLRVELTWTTRETREALSAMVGKWVEIEVILLDVSEGIFSAVFAGREETLFDTESTEYEIMYDRRAILEHDFSSYGYYDHPIQLITEGPNGSTIEYRTLSPEFITSEGVVLRPLGVNIEVHLEATITLGEFEETFVVTILIKALQVREIITHRSFIEDRGMTLVQGIVYHLEHHQDEGVYWLMIYDESGFLRMRVDDSHSLEVGDQIRVSGIYEYEFDNRGKMVEVIYIGEADREFEILEKEIISVREFLTTRYYRGRRVEAGEPVYLSGIIQQDGTAYYLYDELFDERVRIFSQNSIDWSVYKDQYVELMMFVDVTEPIRMLATLEARNLVSFLDEEFKDLRRDSLELLNQVYEQYEGAFDLITEGQYGSTMTWRSDQPELVSDEGVILQTVQRITEVAFRVTIEKEGLSINVTVPVTILAVSDVRSLEDERYSGEAIVDVMVYYIDNYGYVYLSDGTANIIGVLSGLEALQVGESYRVRGMINYATGFSSMAFTRIFSTEPIESDLPLMTFRGPYTVHAINDLNLASHTLITLRGVLHVDNTVYLYDDFSDTKVTVYPTFYTEPYRESNGLLVEMDGIIYRRGESYEIRIDGGPEGIRVLDQDEAIIEYERLYFDNREVELFRNSIDLPTHGPLGTPITEWDSSHPELLDHQGNLLALPSENTRVTFTANLVLEDLVYPITLDAKLYVNGKPIASYDPFHGVKDVFIEGIVYNRVVIDHEYFFFITDGTGSAIIMTHNDYFTVGEAIIVQGQAEYYAGWLILEPQLDYTELKTHPYQLPDAEEMSLETIFAERYGVGKVLRVEVVLHQISDDTLYVFSEDGRYALIIFTGDTLHLTDGDLGQHLVVDVIIIEFYDSETAFAFIVSKEDIIHGD